MRRSGMPVLLVLIGFLLGGLVAVQAQERIFIPFVVQAGSQTGGVEAINLHQTVAGGLLGFFGEVSNDTASAIRLHGVTVYLLDGTGTPVGNVGTLAGLDQVIPPGERLPFLAYTEEPVADWVTYRASAEWEPTEYLAVLSQQLRRIPEGWAIDVRVRNQHSAGVSGPLVVGTLYGPAGKVVGYNWAAPALGFPDPLAPGDEFTATVTFRRDDIYAYDPPVVPSGYGAVAVP